MNEEDQQAPDRDGLEAYYDIVILGTGLVQSILSCVASKHGKKVLHLDKNEFYGEIYGSHSLSSHISYYREICNEVKNVYVEQNPRPANVTVPSARIVSLVNSAASDKYIPLFQETVTGENYATPAKRRPWKSDACHPACFGYSMERERVPTATDPFSTSDNPVFRGYVKHNDLTRSRAVLRDREFNIDTTAKVLYGSCPMVDLMIASGVSNYLEFKTFEGLYFWLEDEKKAKPLLSFSRPDHITDAANADAGTIWKVPCSKGDVFNTTMIGALEKRALMKFHQFVADWGRVNCGTEVHSLNENDVAVGMALYRPQNKQQASGTYRVDDFIDKPFQDFLVDCKISPKLQRIIVYALCCHTAPLGIDCEPYLTRTALNDMFLHIDSIGKFGETAFLAPLYGSSEVVQAFCRMSAVWGGTFILKRSVLSVEVTTPEPAKAEDVDVAGANNAATKSSAPVVSAVHDTEGNSIGCGAFVCGAAYWPAVPAKRRLKVSCTSVWLGVVVPLARSIIIIPANAQSSSYAVHIIQTDASTNASPDGAIVLHMSTLMDVSADEAALSGLAWADIAKLEGDSAVALMASVVQKLTTSFAAASASASASASEDKSAQKPEEISRVVALQPVYDLDAPLPTEPEQADGEATSRRWSSTLPANVRLCTECSDASLSMQVAYEQAKDIFRQLFPDKDFLLNVVEEVRTDEAILQQQDSAACEHDDEMAYLEFALNAALPRESSSVEQETIENTAL